MYEFVTGPMAWFSFLVFFIGLFVRSVLYIKGLDSKLDRVTYRVNTAYGVKTAVKSVFYWLLPFGSKSWRTHPGITMLFFIFHFGLVFTPIFLKAHNMLLKERWGISFITIPEPTADLLTIMVLVSGLFLILRRIALNEVRILTNANDYLVIAITIAPFITGFLAFHHVGDYQFWLIAHIISGEIMLVAVPFTKLSHCFLFFFSRAQVGMDFGIKRGGMKGKGIVW
jgi:nitrate reductase gamma subunit